MKKLFLSMVSGKWRKIITPIAAIAVLSAILFFPRGQVGHQQIAISGQSPIVDSLIEEQTANDEQIDQAVIEPAKIMVDIQGAVKYPGVYSLAEGDRLIDAIHAAGGYLPDAESRLLNHAMILPDEFFLYVPSIGEELDFAGQGNLLAGQAETGQSSDGKVNINLADEQELMTISGIGPSKAAAIIQFREENGSFASPEELMNVSGIGQKTFEKLESFITVK